MQLRISRWVLAATTLVGACQAGGARPVALDEAPVHAPAAPAPAAHVGKPRAPVEVRLASRPVGAGTYEVTLTATPTTAVKALELSLDGRVATVGPTAAGEPRTLTTRVTLGQVRGRELAGSALVDVGGGHRRRAAATVQLGDIAAAAPPRLQIVRLPDGTEVAEVRP